MRLIDAVELMEHVYRDKLDSRELIAQMINNAPTIRTESITHGYWKQVGYEYICSRCGADAGLNFYREHRMTTKYCPYCGTKMDLKE